MKKLKKLFTRIRKWLIRKLGGYTEVFETVTKTEFVAVPIKPVKIQSVYEMYCADASIMNGIDKKDYVKNQLLNGMVDNIFDAMRIQRSDDPREDKIRFKATLYVVPVVSHTEVERLIWQ